MNKKYKLLFITYLIFIISITIFLSTNIINKGNLGFFIFNGTNNELPQLKLEFRRQSNNILLHIELVPNCVGYFDGIFVRLPITMIKINSDGFRDREFSIHKPRDAFRIIALGDSMTFGLGLDIEDTWPKQLENKLNALNNSINYEVLNFGVPGYNTFEEVEMFKEKGIKYNPDMILLGFLVNDILNNTRMVEIINNLRSVENLNLRKDISREASLAILANDIQQKEINNRPFNDTWNIVEDSIDFLINYSKQKNVKLLIIVFTADENQMNALKEISNRNNIILVDLQKEVYSKYPDEILILNPKDTHPSEFACSLIADKIIENIFKNN